MRTTGDNPRLGAALKKAKAGRRGAKRSLWTSKTASKASKAYWSSKVTVPTATIRIHKDAIELAKAAWKDSASRITETSEAIRCSAKRKLGI